MKLDSRSLAKMLKIEHKRVVRYARKLEDQLLCPSRAGLTRSTYMDSWNRSQELFYFEGEILRDLLKKHAGRSDKAWNLLAEMLRQEIKEEVN